MPCIMDTRAIMSMNSAHLFSAFFQDMHFLWTWSFCREAACFRLFVLFCSLFNNHLASPIPLVSCLSLHCPVDNHRPLSAVTSSLLLLPLLRQTANQKNKADQLLCCRQTSSVSLFLSDLCLEFRHSLVIKPCTQFFLWCNSFSTTSEQSRSLKNVVLEGNKQETKRKKKRREGETVSDSVKAQLNDGWSNFACPCLSPSACVAVVAIWCWTIKSYQPFHPWDKSFLDNHTAP